PSEIEVSVSPDRVEKAQIANLDLEQRPQPNEAPLSAPIARTLEAIEVAKRAYQQNQTEKLYQRREKYQRRLGLLQKLQELEQKAFSTLSQVETATLRETAYSASSIS